LTLYFVYLRIGTENFLEGGTRDYPNATPNDVADFGAEFILEKCGENTKVIDPFCGQGSIGRSIINMNMSYVGIDLDRSQCLLSIEKLKIL
jgi:DNA modification methylase